VGWNHAFVRMLATEPEEFTELFRRHAPDIQRYVTRRLGSGVLNRVRCR
jgi:RNA polymerase sigma-70 factor (ECF subfamily)